MDGLAGRIGHSHGRPAKPGDSNPCSISQYALWPRSKGRSNASRNMLAEFAKRREFVASESHDRTIPRLPGDGRGVLRLHQHSKPIWAAATAARRIISTQWCQTLLEQQNVATVMGSAFAR